MQIPVKGAYAPHQRCAQSILNGAEQYPSDDRCLFLSFVHTGAIPFEPITMSFVCNACKTGISISV